jgi:hypothetical protein
MTMEQQAEAARRQAFGQGSVAAGSIIAPPTSVPAAPPPFQFQMTDMLPEAAQRDPEYIQGSGSLYASAQPRMAYKYGVIRNGQLIPPQQVQSGGAAGKLSQATLKDLETLKGLQKPAEAAEEKAEAKADEPTPEEKKAKQERAKKTLDEMGDLDLARLMDAARTDILNNDEQKKIVEGRITEVLSIEDLIMNGEVFQRVPIIPGKFEPRFRSLGVQEDLALKRLIMQEARTLQVADTYFSDKFTFMGVVAGLYELNGNPVPHHLDEKRNFDEDRFWKKFEHLSHYSFWMLQSLCVHYGWFDTRVKNLFKAEAIKNG